VKNMPTNESEIELLARAMIDRHGESAARAAVVRLNQMIDRGDWEARDRWACVVRQIHETHGLRPAFADRERGATTPRKITRAA
jgi:hypothetical protein